MKNLQVITTSFILSSLAFASCSTGKVASTATQDNMYFMASDAQADTEFAVQNNKPESFKTLASEDTDTFSQENFSSRNVNPDYIAKYQAETVEGGDEAVYFDESVDENDQSAENIDTYNNFRVSGSGNNFMNNPGMSFNMGFGMGMMNPWGMGMMNPWGMGMMNPWGMGMMNPWGMGMMNPWGMGGFHDPFFSPWGFRPGLNINMGFGMGGFGMGMGGFGMGMGGFGMGMGGFGMGMGGFGMGMGGFGMGMGGFGMGRFGWGSPFMGMGFGNPMFALPGGEYGDRNVVVGARPTRGASFAGSGYRGNSSSAAVPGTARAQARENAMNNSPINGRSVSSGENSRTSSRDFGASQNDYYSNSRSRVATGTTRNVNSPAVDRGATTRSRSAMPSSRPSAIGGGTNTRSTGGSINTPSRSTSSPRYNRSSSPSYNRSTAPSYNQRSTSPSYNRSTVPSRTQNNSPGFSSPSRSSSSPSFSSPSRSSGGSMGGSSGGSRPGRGN